MIGFALGSGSTSWNLTQGLGNGSNGNFFGVAFTARIASAIFIFPARSPSPTTGCTPTAPSPRPVSPT